MIRAMQASDLEEVMQIWLTANMEAHDFIDSSYWKSHFEEVRRCCLRRKLWYQKIQIPGFWKDL